jgi:hypothetical protein
MKSLPAGTPSNLSSLVPTQRSPSNVLSSPFYRIKSFAPSSPAQLVTPVLPLATATPTPAPALVVIASPDVIAPDTATSVNAEASPTLTERTAFKLAKQLRNFQGCTHEQYYEAD